MGKVDRADNRYNRRKYGSGRLSGGWFHRAKIVAGVALIVGILALQFGPALMDCGSRYSTSPRVGGQSLMRLLVDGRRMFC